MIEAYLNNGNGNFTLKSTTPIPSGGQIVLADFNHDGKLDFATAGNLFALGNGDGTFQTPEPFFPNPPGQFYYIAAGDLNGDGYPDIVVTNLFSIWIYVLINNQHGGFTVTSVTPTPFSSPAQIVLADLSGNGNLDAVIGSSYGGAQIWLGNGQGGLTYLDTLLNPQNLSNSVLVADVNGDGIPDICLLEANTVAIFLGEGNAAFEPQIGSGAGPSPGSFAVGNFHGQPASAGLLDFVVPDASGGVMVLINQTK